MGKIDISTSFEIDDYQLDTQIINAAGEQLLEKYALHNAADMARQAVQAAVDRRAEEVVREIFERGIQLVDGLGDPKGARVPLDEFLAGAVKGWLDQIVDRDGKIDRSGGYGPRSSRAEWLTKKLAIEGLHELAIKEIKALNTRAKAEIAAMVAAAIVDASTKRI